MPTTPRTFCRAKTWALIAGGLTLLPTSGLAAPITWTNPATGSWFTAANWDAGVPTLADDAFVNNGGTAQATGALVPGVRQLHVGAGAGQSAGTVNVQGLQLATGNGQLRVGSATAAGATATGQLTADGAVRGQADTAAFNGFAIGTAAGSAAQAQGQATVGGPLLAQTGLVGSLTDAAGGSATGSLTVGADLQGLSGVGLALNFGGGAPASADGRVTVQSGQLALSDLQSFVVGGTIGAGTHATGSVLVENGNLVGGTSASALFWQIGSASQGTASGSVVATGVDTSSQALGSLLVGRASTGGTGTGRLELGNGSVHTAGSVLVGSSFSDALGTTTATGTLVLAGVLQSSGADRSLAVGQAGVAFGFSDANAVSMGSLQAAGLSDFRFVTFGTASANGGLATVANALVEVGSGGIVNAADQPGTLRIGRSNSVLVNNALTGPGPQVEANVTVGGAVSGYQLVEIGSVTNSGQARGLLQLNGGALSTQFLQLGRVEGGGGTLIDAATDALGQLQVVDGQVTSTEASFVGWLVPGGSPVPHSARGELLLQRSSFTTGQLQVGLNGASGSVVAQENSAIEARTLGMGLGGGDASLTLANSSLTLLADPGVPGSGSLLMARNSGHASLQATASSLDVGGALSIMGSGFGGGGALARMALASSTLTVGQGIGIGNFNPEDRGELVLDHSTAQVQGDVRVGLSANAGQLFGQALLALEASLMQINGDLRTDLGAELLFGIQGLERGLGGYGAINTGLGLLSGLIAIDFAGLWGDLGFAHAAFDLIYAANGFEGDFAIVDVLNLPQGYLASFGRFAAGDGEVWRIELQQMGAVPAPGTLALLLLALAALALTRRPAGTGRPPAR